MSFVTRRELAGEIARRTEMTHRDVLKTIEAFEQTVTETLVAGEKVTLLGFGTFATGKRAKRGYRFSGDPSERVTVPAHRFVRFTPGARLRDAVKRQRGR